MINDMKPGPELDRYYANLIGYQSLTTGLNLDGSYGYIPAYSTTWEGMSLVIEEMQRRGFFYTIQNGSDGKQYVKFEKWNEDYSLAAFGRHESETTPHAAVVAAIQAIQGEDTQS